jgi:5'-nucleotidase
VGINVYYSGTVAAAMEAAFLKIPSVAMSLAAEEHMDFERAAVFCAGVLRRLIPLRLGEPTPRRVPIKSGPSTGFDPSTAPRTGSLTTGLLRAGEVININIPLLSEGEPKGVRVVPQSTGGFHEYYMQQKDEQSQTVFQLAGGPHRLEDNPTDTTSLAEGFITVTPLVPDMTNHDKIGELQKIKW